MLLSILSKHINGSADPENMEDLEVLSIIDFMDEGNIFEEFLDTENRDKLYKKEYSTV